MQAIHKYPKRAVHIQNAVEENKRLMGRATWMSFGVDETLLQRRIRQIAFSLMGGGLNRGSLWKSLHHLGSIWKIICYLGIGTWTPPNHLPCPILVSRCFVRSSFLEMKRTYCEIIWFAVCKSIFKPNWKTCRDQLSVGILRSVFNFHLPWITLVFSRTSGNDHDK